MKHNNDHIPTYGEIESDYETRKEYMKANPGVTRHFKLSYKINGKPFEENTTGSTAAEVEETLRHNCSFVGWYPTDINVKEVEA